MMGSNWWLKTYLAVVTKQDLDERLSNFKYLRCKQHT